MCASSTLGKIPPNLKRQIMKKISYRPVFNRKKKLNEEGKALLQIEAYLMGKKVYFSTHIYLTPEQWDNNKRLIRRHPNAEALNYKVREFIINLENKELAMWKEAIPITLEALKDDSDNRPTLSFLNFIIEDINTSRIKESTKLNRMTTWQALCRFRQHIEFEDVTPRFIYDFEHYLVQCGYQINTVAKHMKHLKSFVNSATDKGYLNSNEYAFRRYRIKMSIGKHSFLHPEELLILENLTFPDRYAYLSHTLDAFLFCCYTGLRYSDFTNLSEENIVMIEGKPWIIFRTIKTDTEVKLPISLLFEGKAWRMLKKHKGHLDKFFAFKPNYTANKELIRIGKLANIRKHISFHTARHTNATLLIHNGVNITTVQKLLGHRNITTTQIYSEVMDSTIIRDLKKCAKSK